MISYYEGEHIVNFERYAQILSNNFNVRVYLDGTRAETHEDNSIHLPNIKNMSPQELDCLYGILLHEIGHVKYSHMNNSDVKKMKGRDHFSIWNGIEDARIENKLMSKLDGANDIFEKLYGVHFRILAKKVFNIEFSDDTDRWHLFCVHVHDYLLKTKRKTFNIEAYSSEVQKEVLDLFAKAKPVIDAQKVTRAVDALSLSTKLFKQFGPKRPKLMKEFSGVFNAIEKSKRELQAIYDAYKNDPVLIELKKKKKELNQERKKLEKRVGKTANSKKNKEAMSEIEAVSNVLDYLHYTESLTSAVAENDKLRQEHAEKLAQIDALKNKAKT